MIGYNGKLYITIVVESFQMLVPSEDYEGYPSGFAFLEDHSSEAIPMPCGPIPMGYGMFEVAECSNCGQGHACPDHSPHNL
jgi:hypothetical protein